MLLQKADMYMQCFLWRGRDSEFEPSRYWVFVKNIGVKLAEAITTIALHKSAPVHEQESPETASQVVKDSYVDDLKLTASDKNKL